MNSPKRESEIGPSHETTADRLSPAQPLYVLRGHSAQINAVCFLRSNTRLLTGDSEGWVILWRVTTRRPVAVWRAHDSAILSVKEWGTEKIITHGRDNKLFVWKLGPSDEGTLSTTLPLETNTDTNCPKPAHNRAPWLLYSLDVNSLNFCGFAMCSHFPLQASAPASDCSPSAGDASLGSILLAIPSARDSDWIDIMQLPSGHRIYSSIGISSSSTTNTETKTGMAMALCLFHDLLGSSNLMLIAGYESGHVCVYRIHEPSSSSANGESTATGKNWEVTYIHKTHSQPVLSLGLPPLPPEVHSSSLSPSTPIQTFYFISSGADAIIAKHPFPSPPQSSLLHSAPSGNKLHAAPVLQSMPQTPLKIVNTKHSGQQSLSIRSDGKIFATAGWDAKVRVYSTKGGMKELAVLKWHKEGLYAMGFGEVLEGTVEGKEDRESINPPESSGGEVVRMGKEGGVLPKVKTVEQMREERERRRHWLAAGSKDGKVSLWEVY